MFIGAFSNKSGMGQKHLSIGMLRGATINDWWSSAPKTKIT